jgi:hypothetical protein
MTARKLNLTHKLNGLPHVDSINTGTGGHNRVWMVYLWALQFSF